MDRSPKQADHRTLSTHVFGGRVMQRLDYRRAPASYVWHWNPNCPRWPTRVLESIRTKPSVGLVCEECGGHSD